MGCFSYNCWGCGHPLLSSGVTNDINAWMQEAVAITKHGSILKGEYDGYGRFDGNYGDDEEELDLHDCTVYHAACFKCLGSPKLWYGTSEPSSDQGYFFDHEHDMPDPRKHPAAREKLAKPGVRMPGTVATWRIKLREYMARLEKVETLQGPCLCGHGGSRQLVHAKGTILLRCLHEECGTLTCLTPEAQVWADKIAKEHPEDIRLDEDVNPAAKELRRAKEALAHVEDEIKQFSDSPGVVEDLKGDLPGLLDKVAKIRQELIDKGVLVT